MTITLPFIYIHTHIVYLHYKCNYLRVLWRVFLTFRSVLVPPWLKLFRSNKLGETQGITKMDESDFNSKNVVIILGVKIWVVKFVLFVHVFTGWCIWFTCSLYNSSVYTVRSRHKLNWLKSQFICKQEDEAFFFNIY